MTRQIKLIVSNHQQEWVYVQVSSSDCKPTSRLECGKQFRKLTRHLQSIVIVYRFQLELEAGICHSMHRRVEGTPLVDVPPDPTGIDDQPQRFQSDRGPIRFPHIHQQAQLQKRATAVDRWRDWDADRGEARSADLDGSEQVSKDRQSES